MADRADNPIARNPPQNDAPPPARSWVSLERVITLLVVMAVAFAAFVYGLRSLEAAITFHPVRSSSAVRTNVPRGAENVWFTTADGIRLHGWFFEAQTKPAVASILYFHGNGRNISDVGWVGERFAVRGFNVLLFDYRGYGESGGEPKDETGLYADGDAALRYVLNDRSVSPERVVLYGQSLGTAVVADLASRQSCGAIILESGLSSASDMASTSFPWLPRWLHFLARNRFESARKLASVRSPILITHGDPDPVIPTDEARVLFAAANHPKKLLTFPGAGHNVFGSVGDRYLKLVEDFITDALKVPQ
jgi:fermentation-respiration switch protein FrsA (DUF1100 family)